MKILKPRRIYRRGFFVCILSTYVGQDFQPYLQKQNPLRQSEEQSRYDALMVMLKTKNPLYACVERVDQRSVVGVSCGGLHHKRPVPFLLLVILYSFNSIIDHIT